MNTAYIWPIVLLFVSNAFMTVAWYGHLKFPSAPMWIAVAGSWGIAFLEYCFQVPGNRLGHVDHGGVFTGAQLLTISEIFRVVMALAFFMLILHEPFKWNYLAGLGLIAAGVYVVFMK